MPLTRFERTDPRSFEAVLQTTESQSENASTNTDESDLKRTRVEQTRSTDAGHSNDDDTALHLSKSKLAVFQNTKSQTTTQTATQTATQIEAQPKTSAVEAAEATEVETLASESGSDQERYCESEQTVILDNQRRVAAAMSTGSQPITRVKSQLPDFRSRWLKLYTEIAQHMDLPSKPTDQTYVWFDGYQEYATESEAQEKPFRKASLELNEQPDVDFDDSDAPLFEHKQVMCRDETV